MDTGSGLLYLAEQDTPCPRRSVYGLAGGRPFLLRAFWFQTGDFHYVELGVGGRVWTSQREPFPSDMLDCYASTRPEADAPFRQEAFAVGDLQVTLEILPLWDIEFSIFSPCFLAAGAVTGPDGQAVQTFADRVWGPAFHITVEDMDFDGWPDFRYEFGDFTYNWTESCWRYEPAAGLFRKDPVLSGLSMPRFDPERREVWSGERSMGFDWEQRCFRWVDGRLTVLRTLSAHMEPAGLTLTVTDAQRGPAAVLWQVTMPDFPDRFFAGDPEAEAFLASLDPWWDSSYFG